MSENAKKITWIAFLILVIAAELTWLWFEGSKYARIRPLNIFWVIPWYVYMCTIGLIVVDYSNRLFSIIGYACISILIVNPVTFQLTKPEYRYMDAVEMIQKAENIPVSNGDDRKVKVMMGYDLAYQLYLVTGVKEEQVVQFIFDPYNGEYFMLDQSSHYP